MGLGGRLKEGDSLCRVGRESVRNSDDDAEGCSTQRTGIISRLQKTLSNHRIGLIDHFIHCTFESIQEYHNSFIITRSFHGEDDSMAWVHRGRPL